MITKCTNNECPLRYSCLRYNLPDSPLRIIEKFHPSLDEELDCEHWLPIDDGPTVKTEWDIRKCFEELRFDKNHHLGFGDIRLTIAQQEEICGLVERFYRFR